MKNSFIIYLEKKFFLPVMFLKINKYSLFRFELDNFELYSGTPSQFSVYISDKLHDELDAWEKVGTFKANSHKKMGQSFYNTNELTFAKFVRVELEASHGSELICTITSFR